MPKDGRVGTGETAKGTGSERQKNGKKTELTPRLKAKNINVLNAKTVPLKVRSWDVDVAFKEVSKLVRSGVVKPSKYGLQNWTTEVFGCLPSRKDIDDWQTEWLKQGLIEPLEAGNGKKTYKLKVKNAGNNHEQ